MKHTIRNHHSAIRNRQNRQSGFTLLEMMVVISILIFIAAMVYPAAGRLSDLERERITRERMEEIRRAIVGDPDRFDAEGLRIIGGYVGDMGAWPDLYEAAAQQRQNVGGNPVFNLNNAGNPNNFYYRPMGHFVGNGWQWDYPYRRLTDDTTHDNDHIGGLETENEGQPVGLWIDDPTGDGSQMLDPARWQGPYLVPPTDGKPEDALQFAKNDGEYEELEPLFSGGAETWEDGDYNPSSGDPGEHFDEKEDFRLRQNEYRMEDGWNRAIRFFITADPAHAGESIFWMISEGLDFEGTYPAKGTVGGTIPADTMANSYDPTDSYNVDNIVMKIHSHEWQAVFDELNQRRRGRTEDLFSIIRRALIGESTPATGGFNSGFTGALCRWPRLFQWEVATTSWDDESAASVSYTKGQPRGLWNGTPNVADAADNLPASSLAVAGIGWSGAFLPSSFGTGDEEKLVDGWGREILFFKDAVHDNLLILSRGPDGMFDFYDTDTLPAGAPDGMDDYLDPASPAEAVDNTTYDPNGANGYNADNVVMLVEILGWQPGWFTLEKFTVFNATAGANGTKAMFVYGYDSATATILSSILTAAVLTDEDGDAVVDDWARGGPAPNEAFLYTDVTVDTAVTGTRALVLWNDTDGNNAVDSGEGHWRMNYNLYTHNGHEPRNELIVDTGLHFIPAP